MDRIEALAHALLLEQDSKLSVITRAITERLPLTISYKGEDPREVRPGQRMDIEPVVLGPNARSGNLVMWAYVFKGVSKKGLPGWKMFRIDRIQSAKINMDATPFELNDLPEYVEGKAPNLMRSLSRVDVYSPYWFEPEDIQPGEAPPQQPQEPQPAVQPEPEERPQGHPSALARRVFSDLEPQIRDVNGRRVLRKSDYDTALDNLYGYQEDQFNNRQRMIGGNERPGEGTRKRFKDTSKFELDRILARDNVMVDNGPEIQEPQDIDNNDEMLAEGRRIQTRFKRLIKW